MDDKDCSHFDTQSEAQRFFERHQPGDPPRELRTEADLEVDGRDHFREIEVEVEPLSEPGPDPARPDLAGTDHGSRSGHTGLAESFDGGLHNEILQEPTAKREGHGALSRPAMEGNCACPPVNPYPRFVTATGCRPAATGSYHVSLPVTPRAAESSRIGSFS